MASDCAFVVKGFSRRRWEEPSSNGDIWHLIGEALSSTPPLVRKVKAHTSFEDLRIGLISNLDFYGNAIADGLAGRGAEENAVSPNDAANVGLADQLAWQVQRRILAASRAAIFFEQARREPRLPRLKRPPPEAPDVKVARRRLEANHTFVAVGSGRRCRSCLRTFSKATFLAAVPEQCPGLIVSVPGIAPPPPASNQLAPDDEPASSPRLRADLAPEDIFGHGAEDSFAPVTDDTQHFETFSDQDEF